MKLPSVSLALFSFVIAAGCGSEKGSSPAPSAKSPSALSPAVGAASASTAEVTIEDNEKVCAALFGDDVKTMLGVEGEWKFAVHKRDLGPATWFCSWMWPPEGAPKGLISAKFHCSSMRPKKDQMLKAWKDFQEVDLDGPAWKLDIAGIPQFWTFSDDPKCSVVTAAGFGAKDKLEAFTRHTRAQLGKLPL